MPGKNSSHKLVGAAVIAGFLVFLSGWAYRTLAAQLALPLTTTAIAPDALRGIPLRIADWVGEDIPLEEAIVRRTDTDAHINRRYSRGLELVSLYIGGGAKTRDLIQHRPESCYIGAGWARTGRSLRELPLKTGALLPCTVLEFSRGGLNTGKIMVVNYYIVDGNYCQTASEWRYRFWRIGYVAQVEIVASVTEAQSVDEVTRIVCDFAVDSAPSIATQCAQMEAREAVASAHESREGKGH